MSNRSELRTRYNIEGSGVMDCLGAFCCPACGLVQESKEIRDRTQAPAAGNGYAMQNGGMNYPK